MEQLVQSKQEKNTGVLYVIKIPGSLLVSGGIDNF